MQLTELILPVRLFLQQRGIPHHDYIDPPTPPAQVADLERQLGQRLPIEIAEHYSTGQGRPSIGWRDRTTRHWGSSKLRALGDMIAPTKAFEFKESIIRLRVEEGRMVDSSDALANARRFQAVLPLWPRTGSGYREIGVDCACADAPVIAYCEDMYLHPDESAWSTALIVIAPSLRKFFERWAAVAFQFPVDGDWTRVPTTSGGPWSSSAFNTSYVVPSLRHFLDS